MSSRAQQDNWSRVPPEHLVVGLCAAWCGTCREFQETFEALERRHPERSFVWLDVEDDAAIAGDIDVENFPSLVVFKRGTPVFFGVTLPQQGWLSGSSWHSTMPLNCRYPSKSVRSIRRL